MRCNVELQPWQSRASEDVQVQVRQGSTFTESLGENTDSETGMAKGSPEEDISVIAASDRSSASRAASGES